MPASGLSSGCPHQAAPEKELGGTPLPGVGGDRGVGERRQPSRKQRRTTLFVIQGAHSFSYSHLHFLVPEDRFLSDF